MDFDGLTLLQRSPDGWLSLGAVALDDPELSGTLSSLLEAAQQAAEATGDPLRTKLVLPNSEILYESVDVSGLPADAFPDQISQALEGRTPYKMSELVFDYVVEDGWAKVAVVARQTLDEAEAFADQHGFNPISFVAKPPAGTFIGEPLFGLTRASAALMKDTDPLVRDAEPVVIGGTAPIAEAPKVTFASSRTVAKESAETKDPRLLEIERRMVLSVADEAEAPADPPESDAKAPPAEDTDAKKPDKMGRKLAVAVAAVFVLAIIVTVLKMTEPLPAPEAAVEETGSVAELPVEDGVDPPAALDVARLPETAPEALTESPPALALETPTVTDPLTLRPTTDELAEGLEAETTPGRPLVLSAPVGGSLRPGLIDTETYYAARGIWQRSPDPLPQPREDSLIDLYEVSLDPQVAQDDALAMPLITSERDVRPISPEPPLGPGQEFVLNEEGLVEASPEGTLNPEGVRVFSEAEGPPPPSRPEVEEAEVNAELAALAEKPPRARPANAVEILERRVYGGYTQAELLALRPAPRPESAQDLVPAEEAASVASLAQSRRPQARPNNIAELVAAARRSPAVPNSASTPATVTGVVASGPVIPTRASVARQATIENAMSLGQVNLIGVYGSASSRRALVRLASGRYVKVEVGDRVDGGKVAAIGEDSLQYVKGGRNVTLEVPTGG